MPSWNEQFGALFAPQYIDFAQSDVQFAAAAPPEEAVSRIHVVGRHRGGVVVCVVDHQKMRFLPGGTREPGETVEQNLDRELMEEAGARRTGPWSYLGAFRAYQNASEPYRSHLPYPVSYWAYAVADLDLVADPTNPPDGEQVSDVLTLPPTEAADFLAVHDPIHADVVRLADAMGLLPG